MADELKSIVEVASKGVVKDTPPIALAPNIFTDVKNVRFKDNAIRKMEGELLLNDITSDLSSPLSFGEIRHFAVWENPNKQPTGCYYIWVVDLLNNIALLQYLNLNIISENGLNFYKKWISQEKLDYINISSRTIRKIQSKCYIYHLYEENKRQNKLQQYSGYIFDKIKKEGDGKYQYMVYLPDINITTYINLLEDLDNYTKHLFSLFVFINEENDKKKIKLQLCYEK